MIPFVETFNFAVMLLFALCYAYQMVYIVVRLIQKTPHMPARRLHRYAVLIPARNEQAVLGKLLESIEAQRYPRELVDVYVVADNCQDDTAGVARTHGATVIMRTNHRLIGKGYALDYALARIRERVGLRFYDGYFVIDADNVLDERFIAEMNATFDQGYRVVTSYRNSKNYGTNWISAGYGLWFLRESQYVNGARMALHTSCAISGTGFLVSSEIFERDGGWKQYLLTEDIEFSVANALRGEVIGYCERAVLYDEQPEDFRSSWKQRMRWAKGFYQVFARYGGSLARGCFGRRGFQCYDMLMTVAPATVLTLLTLGVNSLTFLQGIMRDMRGVVLATGQGMLMTLAGVYATLLLFGLVTTITEWRQIHCAAGKKVLYLFTFPLFMFTYIPIAVAALVRRVTWEPIAHNVRKDVSQIIEG